MTPHHHSSSSEIIFPYVDAHAHLSFPDYDQDRDAIVERLKAAGVGVIINPGTNLTTSKDAIRCADRFDFVYANVGLHPCDANDFSEVIIPQLEALVSHPKVVAIGEIGLDFHYPDTVKPSQMNAFREMIRLAKRHDLPLIIHTRDAWKETFTILEEEHHSAMRGMMHCFSGGVDEAKHSLKLGFKISIPGIVTFKKSTLPSVVAALALEDMLTETDCPFLAPVPHRGKRNEPAFVVEVANAIASIRSCSAAMVTEAVYRTSTSLFGLPFKDPINEN